ncbi:MAG: PD-(D/E)XK nuclease-like domain-containing protein [Lachnospiraceae bacterium]|nr:PD-(D/E)XK nuclease-like domain-containing protein [Lachnospiraceae bacterium]
MKFSQTTREDIIKHLFKNLHLNTSLCKNKDKTFDNILKLNIIYYTYILVRKRKLENINGNYDKLIAYAISLIDFSEEKDDITVKEFIDAKNSIEYYFYKKNITNTEVDIDTVRVRDKNNINLVLMCINYIEFYRIKQNKYGIDTNNNVASDSYLFEKLLFNVACDKYDNIIRALGGYRDESGKTSYRHDIGMKLEADVIIRDTNLILDAKFVGSNIITDDKKAYCKSEYRGQMLGYMVQYESDFNVKPKGVIVHAVDKEKYYDKHWYNLENRYMSIGNYEIKLVFIAIDDGFEAILNQMNKVIKGIEFRAYEV